jgi:hypothetical protein
MDARCTFCDGLYPAEHNECPVCGTENPARAWEASEAKRLREQPMGDEAARPFEITGWTGIPSDLATWTEGPSNI